MVMFLPGSILITRIKCIGKGIFHLLFHIWVCFSVDHGNEGVDSVSFLLLLAMFIFFGILVLTV